MSDPATARKALIYRVVEEYLQVEEPDELEELEEAFEEVYPEVEAKLAEIREAEASGEEAARESASAEGTEEGAHRLPRGLGFDSPWTEPTLVVALTWLASRVIDVVVARGLEAKQALERVRAQAAAGEGREARRLRLVIGLLLERVEELEALRQRDEATVAAALARAAATAAGTHADLLILVTEERRLPPQQEAAARAEEIVLRFHLKTENPDLELFFRPFRSPTFRRDPIQLFADLYRDFQNVRPNRSGGTGPAEELVAGAGVRLFEALLPKEMRRELWRLQDRVETVHVVSDEGWVPWELLKLKDPDSGEVGPFLVEAFAITRWLTDRSDVTTLPLREVALVVPQGLEAEDGPKESDLFAAIDGDRHRVTRVRARLAELLDALAAGRHDGLHFAGHGLAAQGDPNRWSLQLDGHERLTPPLLSGKASGLGRARPLVFLNACHSGRGALTLTGLGGWAPAFLDAGAGAFLGAYWAVLGDRAHRFAEAFYASFLGGTPFGEAVRKARLELKEAFPGDPTWLAYTVFGNPVASVAGPVHAHKDRRGLGLDIPEHRWQPDRSPPAALLRAEYGVVPFHGREKELEDLRQWCTADAQVRIRLYTGQGGMGKTRLALELCKRMRRHGWWTGLLSPEGISSPDQAAGELVASGGPLLVVVDYAETRRELLVPLLRRLHAVQDKGPFRLILLARWREEWWQQLKAEGEGAGELIAGPATSHHALGPLASSTEERAASYGQAAAAFAATLGRPVPQGLPPDLDAPYFKVALLLHISALGAVEGVDLGSEEGILDYVLDRERRYWQRLATERGLPGELLRGISRALTAISLGGGCLTEADTIEVLEHLKLFADQKRATLATVAHLLHDAYPGEGLWVEPLRPDILHEHLVEREFDHAPEELYGLLLEREERMSGPGAEP